MCSDALQKREALDHTMVQHRDDLLGTGPLSDLEWKKIGAVMTFLRKPRQVMESLAANNKSSLDLVQLSIAHLIKHCEASEEQLKEIDDSISAIGMKTKLEQYETKLVQLPAIVVGYFNPQIPKPSDPAKLRQLKDSIRAVLQEQYADKTQAIEPRREPVFEDVCQQPRTFPSSRGERDVCGGPVAIRETPPPVSTMPRSARYRHRWQGGGVRA